MKQGLLGDCWFLCACAALQKGRHLLHQVSAAMRVPPALSSALSSVCGAQQGYGGLVLGGQAAGSPPAGVQRVLPACSAIWGLMLTATHWEQTGRRARQTAGGAGGAGPLVWNRLPSLADLFGYSLAKEDENCW